MGNKCFLLPDQEKFPICRALSENSPHCEIDPRAIQTAKQRAMQYRYYDVAKKAERLQQKMRLSPNY